MESMLAAYGSGAAEVSHARRAPILNIDIGGGTTKLALVENGNVVHTAAVHLGGRLAVVDSDSRFTRLDPAGRRLAALAGCNWNLGETVSASELDRVSAWMADALVTLLTQDPVPRDVQSLWLTEPLGVLAGIAGAMFSGGVGEYVYGREERDFGDLGRRFGRAVRERIEAGRFPFALLPAGECIRATALGASEYSVQLSGNTIYVSSPGELLPRRNLQVIQPRVKLGEKIEPAKVASDIRDHLRKFDVVEGQSEIALAFRWGGAPAYPRIAALARGLVDALPETIRNGKPLFLILDADIAQTLGAILKDELHVTSEVLVLDGIALWDFDYIDLGRVRMPSFTVPVTIKSLVFSADPRVPHRRADAQGDTEPAGHLHGHHHHHHHHHHDHGHHHHDSGHHHHDSDQHHHHGHEHGHDDHS
jgi:ethanolamine utilization protein EutA